MDNGFEKDMKKGASERQVVGFGRREKLILSL